MDRSAVFSQENHNPTIENQSHLRYTACSERVCYRSVVLSAAAGPQQVEAQPDNHGSACIPIDDHMRIDSLELRTRNLEAQHVWLRLEQLEAQVRSQGKVLASLVEDGDWGAVA